MGALATPYVVPAEFVGTPITAIRGMGTSFVIANLNFEATIPALVTPRNVRRL